MQLHGSETVSANGSGPYIDDDEHDEEFGNAGFDYSQLFDAPNYADFIKTKPNSNAQKYERRVQSIMKAGMVMSLNADNVPDAATFLKHGPGFAKAAGNLAAEDARAARIIDMLTAPDSPYLTFAMVALPLFAQLARNHQEDVKQAATTWRERRADRKQAKASGYKPQKQGSPITVRVFKREIKLPIRFRLKLPNFKNVLGAFVARSQHPEEIAVEVFSDPAVQRAVHKMGIYPRGEAGNEDAA